MNTSAAATNDDKPTIKLFGTISKFEFSSCLKNIIMTIRMPMLDINKTPIEKDICITIPPNHNFYNRIHVDIKYLPLLCDDEHCIFQMQYKEAMQKLQQQIEKMQQLKQNSLEKYLYTYVLGKSIECLCVYDEQIGWILKKVCDIKQ